MAQFKNELIQRSVIAHGHVVDLVQCPFLCGGCRQHIGLHRIGHKAEVPTGLAIAIDKDRLPLQQRRRPLRDHGRKGHIGILAGIKHVEVAQANRIEAIAAGKDVGVELIDIIGHRIRTQRPANVFLDLERGLIVPIDAAAGRIGDALGSGIARDH